MMTVVWHLCEGVESTGEKEPANMTKPAVRFVDPTITTPFSSEAYRAASPRTEAKGYYACPCCGRATKNNDPTTLYVEVVYPSGMAHARYRAADGKGAEGTQDDSQGCFSVGSTCARKLRKLGAAVFTLEPL